MNVGVVSFLRCSFLLKQKYNPIGIYQLILLSIFYIFDLGDQQGVS